MSMGIPAAATPHSKRLRAIAEQLARRILRERGDVVAIAIVGSVARGEARAGSDLDIDVVVRRGRGNHVSAVVDGTIVSLSFTPRSAFARQFGEATGWLAQRLGGLRADVLYDPGGLFPKLRDRVARLPAVTYRRSAREALVEMYEYLGKLRKARWRGDHANLVYAAWVVGVNAIRLVALVNRRWYASENTLWTEWRSFPSLPPRFSELDAVACGFRRTGDAALARTTEALWRTCERWARRRGIRLPRVRSVRSIPISSRKTT